MPVMNPFGLSLNFTRKGATMINVIEPGWVRWQHGGGTHHLRVKRRLEVFGFSSAVENLEPRQLCRRDHRTEPFGQTPCHRLQTFRARVRTRTKQSRLGTTTTCGHRGIHPCTARDSTVRSCKCRRSTDAAPITSSRSMIGSFLHAGFRGDGSQHVNLWESVLTRVLQ
jgi:hypothetical protein